MTRKDKIFAQNWVEQYRRNLIEQGRNGVEGALDVSLTWYGAICSFLWFISTEEELFGRGNTWSRRAECLASEPFIR